MKLISHLGDFFKIYWQKSLWDKTIKCPKNIVRFFYKRSELLKIINETIASSTEAEWDDALIQKVINNIWEKKDKDSTSISVYNIDILSPLDPCHALAIIAVNISKNDFQQKKATGCTGGTLIIPFDCIQKSTTFKFTPTNNLNFGPADRCHFDLLVHDKKEFAISILKGIKEGSIKYALLQNEDKTYWIQAAIAYAQCLATYGNLDPSAPPPQWRDGKDLTAAMQIDILKHLAQLEKFTAK